MSEKAKIKNNEIDGRHIFKIFRTQRRLLYVMLQIFRLSKLD